MTFGTGVVHMKLAIPPELKSGPVRLRFVNIVSPGPEDGLVPFYHFDIVNPDDVVVGHINFRIGDTRHVRMCAGHVGYAIRPDHHGHSYAFYACNALAPFIRYCYDRVIITVDPSNLSSKRVIEKLNTTYKDQVDVPSDDPAYSHGARKKLRYAWRLDRSVNHE
jgi:RimJ/RimL family protein N-acetyltransferase